MADGSEEYGNILKEETFELAKTNAIICIKRMLNNRVSYPYPQEINVEINGIINYATLISSSKSKIDDHVHHREGCFTPGVAMTLSRGNDDH